MWWLWVIAGIIGVAVAWVLYMVVVYFLSIEDEDIYS